MSLNEYLPRLLQIFVRWETCDGCCCSMLQLIVPQIIINTYGKHGICMRISRSKDLLMTILCTLKKFHMSTSCFGPRLQKLPSFRSHSSCTFFVFLWFVGGYVWKSHSFQLYSKEWGKRWENGKKFLKPHELLKLPHFRSKWLVIFRNLEIRFTCNEIYDIEINKCSCWVSICIHAHYR